MKMPGFTKFACPSSLFVRKSGNRLSPGVSDTPAPVRRMLSRSQKLKMPPANSGESTIESNPRAWPSRGCRRPKRKTTDALNRIQSRSTETSPAAICALMVTRPARDRIQIVGARAPDKTRASRLTRPMWPSPGPAQIRGANRCAGARLPMGAGRTRKSLSSKCVAGVVLVVMNAELRRVAGTQKILAVDVRDDHLLVAPTRTC